MADEEKPLGADANKYVQGITGKYQKALSDNFDGEKIKVIVASIEDGATQVAKAFGQGREQITEIRSGLANAVTKVVQLGGTQKDVIDLQLESSKALGRNVILASDSYEKLYATAQVTGVANSSLINGFKNAGFSLYEVSNQMQKVMDTARSIGVDAQAVSQSVVTNLDSLNKYNFQGGVEGLSKMAAQAVNLRVDMKSTFDLADKLFNPEEAIKMASAMQRLGVTQSDLLDPLRLMDLAQNDPAELQNQIAEMSKSFTKLNADGHFEILPDGKRQLMEISKELNISYGEITKMALGGAELDDKLSKISFPEFATKEQKEMLANITEMGKNGDMMIKVDGAEMDINAALEKYGTSEESFNELVKASQPKEIIDIAEDQLTTSKLSEKHLEALSTRFGLGMAGQKIVTDAENASRLVTKGVTKITSGESLTSKGLGNQFGGMLCTFIDSVNKGTPMLEALGTAAKNSETFIKGAWTEALDNSAKSIKSLGESTNPLLKFFTTIAESGKAFIEKDQKIDLSLPVNKMGSNVNAPLITPLNNAQSSINGNSSNSTIKVEPVKVDLNVKVEAPTTMDVTQLTLALNDPSIKQTLIKSLQDALSGVSGTSPLNSIQKQQNLKALSELGVV